MELTARLKHIAELNDLEREKKLVDHWEETLRKRPGLEANTVARLASAIESLTVCSEKILANKNEITAVLQRGAYPNFIAVESNQQENLRELVDFLGKDIPDDKYLELLLALREHRLGSDAQERAKICLQDLHRSRNALEIGAANIERAISRMRVIVAGSENGEGNYSTKENNSSNSWSFREYAERLNLVKIQNAKGENRAT